MARQTALSVVRSMVKAECAKSLQSGSNADDAQINQLIANVQNELVSLYDWSFLKLRWTLSVAPLIRYINFPTQDDLGTTFSVNFNRPTHFLIKWNDVWQDIAYGIDEYPEFNYLDSDRKQVLDPVQRWQFNDGGQFEIWPLPASNQILRFVGQRMPTPLSSDFSTLDLDDLLVTYFVSAKYLAQKKDSRAELVSAEAQRHLLSLRGSYPTRTQTITIGRGIPLDRKAIRQVPLVLVGGK